MKQPRYNSLVTLLAGGTHASAGAAAHGAALNLQVASKEVIDAALSALLTNRDNLAIARSELVTARSVLRARKQEAHELLRGSRDILRRTLGNQYSTAWIGTGFTNSLEMPRSLAPLQNVLGTMKAYLVEHPELERAELLTAELIGTALDALTNADTAVQLQESVVGTHLTALRESEKVLRIRLRWLIEELGRKIGPLDDRWTAFGLNKPGLKQAPSAPVKVDAERTEQSDIAVSWDKAPRAEYYRIWIKVIGVHEEPVVIGNRSERDFVIEGMPTASEVEVYLTAVNSGGESGFSTVVKVSPVP